MVFSPSLFLISNDVNGLPAQALESLSLPETLKELSFPGSTLACAKFKLMLLIVYSLLRVKIVIASISVNDLVSTVIQQPATYPPGVQFN